MLSQVLNLRPSEDVCSNVTLVSHCLGSGDDVEE